MIGTNMLAVLSLLSGVISPVFILMVFSIGMAVWAFLLFRKNQRLTLMYEKQNNTKGELLEINKKFHEELNDKEAEFNHLFKLNTMYLHEIESLREDLKQAKLTAEESDMLKSNFLANMSHEIRTPMNGILGFAQILQQDEFDRDQQLRYLDIIHQNGTVLINLIEDIIDTSKIEVGQLTFTKKNTNLDDLMFDLYTFFNEVKFKQEKDHITLRLLNLNDDENNLLFTDGHRLHQILSNLISNSLKFTLEGVVEFGYVNDVDQKEIVFFVRDSGIGIPEDKQGIIFEKFRQIEAGSTRKYGGTGIGLFISKRIVDLLGGSIWVESEEGKGSTFKFSLPYEEVTETEDDAVIFFSKRREYDWSDKTIVVADDLDTNYRLLSEILSPTEAKVIWKKDGEEVVSYCRENPNVDLILMDIQMPKLDGYEATRIIKEINPEIVIIAQTAYAMPNDNLKCIEAGCNDYIPKPINMELLYEKIDSYFNVEAKTKVY